MRIEFAADGVPLVGELRVPDSTEPCPALVLTGPFTGVRDQVTGLYAERLAARGFVTLAFDHRNWGESGGEPRCHEDPQGKLHDLRAAVSFLRSRPEADGERIGAVGICLGGGYALKFAAFDPRVKAFAGIAGAYNNPYTMRAGDGLPGGPGLLHRRAGAAGPGRAGGVHPGGGRGGGGRHARRGAVRLLRHRPLGLRPLGQPGDQRERARTDHDGQHDGRRLPVAQTGAPRARRGRPVLLARRRRGGVQAAGRAEEAGLAGRQGAHRPVRPRAVRDAGRRGDGGVPARASVVEPGVRGLSARVRDPPPG
ncbi:alpha/beta hydrolase [Nonomuraea ferruginea]